MTILIRHRLMSLGQFMYHFVNTKHNVQPLERLYCFPGAEYIDKEQPVRFEGKTFLSYPNEVQRE